MQIFQIDEHLVNVVVKATRDGLAMAGLKPLPIGLSKYISNTGYISSIIGFVGSTSGSMMLNTSEKAGCFMAGRMLGENYAEINSQVLDGISELANIIAGQIKATLSTTEHKFDRISVPSIVVGSSYFISHYKGMTSLSVEFEVPELKLPAERANNFSVSMALMKI